MTTVDKTTASDAELARVAAFDAAPEPAEVVEYREKVERVARAIFAADAHTHGGLTWDNDDFTDWERDVYLRLAAAAIAELPVSPAEEALRRVEALADELGRVPHIVDPLVTRVGVARRIRAALAAPLAGQHTTDEETDRG